MYIDTMSLNKNKAFKNILSKDVKLKIVMNNLESYHLKYQFEIG